MTDLERYLRLATWGLTGAQRKTVRMELESHIRQKVWKYQVSGITEPQAIQRALEDLGAPHVVSAGMNQVYTMPFILRNSLLCAVLATLGVSNLSSSVAQVSGTTRIPIQECASGQKEFIVVTQPMPCEQDRLWLSLSSLRAVLEPKGVKFSQAPGFPSGTTMTFMRFPETNVDVTLQPDRELVYRSSSGGGRTFTTQPDYFSITDLVNALTYAPLPVTISGWDNPELSVGQTKFTLGAPEQTIRGDQYFNWFFNRDWLEDAFPTTSPSRNPDDLEEMLFVTTLPNLYLGFGTGSPPHNYRITVKSARKDDVFLVLDRQGPLKFLMPDISVSSVRRVYIAPADANGSFQFISSSKRLNLSSPEDLPRGVIDGDGSIAVLRFTGRLDSGAPRFARVEPSDVTVQAVK
jgi:hypothetical protein